MTNKKNAPCPSFCIASDLECSIVDLEGVRACLDLYRDRLGDNVAFCKKSPGARMGTFVEWYDELDLIMMVAMDKLRDTIKDLNGHAERLHEEARRAVENDRQAAAGHGDIEAANS